MTEWTAETIKEAYPYLYETHLHTSQGSACGKAEGAQMARACKAAGYTGIFVTDHNWGGNTAVEDVYKRQELERTRQLYYKRLDDIECLLNGKRNESFESL